jgi:uncharacterized protein involved in high-affinity Fe2+ transport
MAAIAAAVLTYGVASAAEYPIGKPVTANGSGSAAVKGMLMPMVASDGPHYGDNVKLAGPGNYKLVLTIAPPGSDHSSHFGRHVDKETGVDDWFKPFTAEYTFTFAGIGKKGGY